MSKEAMLTAEVAVLTELVRVLSDKVNELEAKQEQGEPVAVLFQDGSIVKMNDLEFVPEKSGQRVQMLYTTPQQRKPLTDEEIRKWWARDNDLEDCDMCKIDDFVKVVRAIEAAHGIKETS